MGQSHLYNRRAFIRLAGGIAVAAGLPLRARANDDALTDIAGRTLRLRLPASRIVLGDGPLAYVVALLRPGNPFSTVVGWGDNFRAADLAGYEAFRTRFPTIERIPTFRGSEVGALDVEQAIGLEPDVMVLNFSSRAAAESSGLLAHLADAGIPTVFVDFRTQMFANAEASVRIMGRLLGAEARAEEFLRFRAEQIARVLEPLRRIDGRPRVMLERAAGLYDDCCLSYGDGNFGQLLAQAGGENLGTRLLHGAFGTLHPEQVIAADPDVVLVTGADWSLYSPSGDWVRLEPGANPEDSRARLARLMQRPAYRNLGAVANGRVYAIWHAFYDNPCCFVALQQIAKWLHPQLFTSLQADQTFRELHARFLPIPYQPGYWVSLEETA
ncbi:ABC transporter substrate-binding protein [Pseudomonas aeruginosa]|nr:ABC transporter substrate-binding protein [Pseudomonas aeruginosa]